MLTIVMVLVVAAASSVAVSPPRPPCGMRPIPITPTRPPYRPPYYPSYPGTGRWVCYSYYGGTPSYYGSYYPRYTAAAAPTAVAAAAPRAVAPYPYYYSAPAAAAAAPRPAAPTTRAAAPYPYYTGAARPVVLPMPLMPGQMRRARSVTDYEAQQQPLMIETTAEAEHHLPSIHEGEQQPSPAILEATPETHQQLIQPTMSPAAAAASTGKVAVSVVFSTSNTNTQHFFTQQLYPAVHALSHHLTLDLLPHLEGGCESGSSACLGSSLVVCASEVLPIPALQLAFSACLMKGTLSLQDQSYPAVMNVAKMCMGPFSVLTWMQMGACVSSGRGEQLYHAAAERLDRLVLGPQSAPLVAFNQEVVIADAGALSLFPALLCHQLGNVPEANAFCSYYTQLN